MASVLLTMTCTHPKNLFCFVCGVYTKSHHKRSIMTKPLIDAYEAYFVHGRTLKRNYVHGPSSVCNDCNNALLRWASGLVRQPGLMFNVPMIWSEPRNHQTDCYFCLTKPAAPGRRSARYLDESFEYPDDLCSALKPRLVGDKAAELANGTSSRSPMVTRRGRSTGAIMNATTASIQAPRMLNRVASRPVAMNVAPQVNNPRVRLFRQTGPIFVAGMKRKSSLDPPSVNTYDVTKVRLRSSEPSIVLEQSEKRLPSNSVAPVNPAPAPVRLYQPTRPTVPVAPMNPTITRVFSLQGEISAYDDPNASPTAFMRAINGHIDKPLTIEIDDDDDDDDDEEEPVQATKQQMDDEAMQEDAIMPKQERHDDGQETDAPLQELAPAEGLKAEVRPEEGNEQQLQQPVEENCKPPMAAAGEFINIHSLPSASYTASSKMVVVKMESPRTSNVAQSSTPSGVTDMPNTANATTTSTNTTTSTPSFTQLLPGGTGRAPHLITQSELILLLRDLELTREKSAILIDRLKRWNLLAAQLIKPTQQQNSVVDTAPEQPVMRRVIVPTAEQSKPRVHPVVRRVSTMAALSSMGSVTIKQGGRTPIVLTTPTSVQRNGSQSFIRLASAAVQSNTVTTSNSRNNNGKITVTANGVPVLRQPVLQTVSANRSPVRIKIISPSKLVDNNEHGNSCA